jgi:hypothetical protein
MLARLKNLQIGFTKLLKPLQLSTMSGSLIQQSSPRAMKRQKLDHDHQEVATGAAADHAAQEEVSEAELVEREMGLPSEFEKKYENEIDYRNKLVLAPMVRTGSCKSNSYLLAVRARADDSAYGTTIILVGNCDTDEQRLLSLYYGAGLVWSPEVVDRAIIGSERVVDRKFTPLNPWT